MVDIKTGSITEPWRRWLEGGRVSTTTQLGANLSGQAERTAQLEAQLAAEIAARIAADAALAGSGDGSGTSDSSIFSGIVSAAAAWVTASTCTLTPTVPGGDYTIDVSPDIFIGGHLSVEPPAAQAVFNGLWRLREEENGGGTPVTLLSGTFTVTFTPESVIDVGEGGGTVTIPESWEVAFVGLPSSPIAATYDGIMVDVRLEISRDTGTNEITAPGLSGSTSVAWTP